METKCTILGDKVRVSLHDYVLKSWLNIRFVRLDEECLERTDDLQRKEEIIKKKEKILFTIPMTSLCLQTKPNTSQ
jgi:hypothetical protein